MPFFFRMPWMAALLLLCVAACGPRYVVLEGKRYNEKQVGGQLYDEGTSLIRDGRWEEGRNKLLALIYQFPESNSAGNAYAVLGREYQQRKQCASARLYLDKAHALGASLEKEPSFQKAREACGGGAARPAETPVVSENPRDPMSREFVDALAAEGRLVEAIEQYDLLWKKSGSTARPELEARLLMALDQAIAWPGLQKLYVGLDPSGFARAPLTVKYAKTQGHLGALQEALGTAQDFLDHALSDSRWFKEMQEYANHLQQRLLVEPRKVGILLPLSGEYEQYGRDMFQGILQGFGLAGNNAGSLQLVVRDTQNNPGVAVQAVDDLIVNEHVIAVLGTLFQAESQAVANRAQQMGVPFLTLTRKEDITQTGNFVFRNALTAAQQAESIAHYAIDNLKFKRFAVLYPQVPFGEESRAAFVKAVEARGGKVVKTAAYDQDATSFAKFIRQLVSKGAPGDLDAYRARQAEIKKIENPYRRKKALEKLQKSIPPAVNFDALFIPDQYRTVGMVAPALAFEDIIVTPTSASELQRMKEATNRQEIKTITLLGGSGWNDDRLLERGGKYVNGAYFCDTFFLHSNYAPVAAFVEAFQSAFERPPTFLEAQSYDSALLLRQILEKQQPRTRQDLRDKLAQTANFPGVTGMTTFGADRNAQKSLFILTINDDQIMEVEYPGRGQDSM